MDNVKNPRMNGGGLLGNRPTNAHQQGQVETSLVKLIWRGFSRLHTMGA